MDIKQQTAVLLTGLAAGAVLTRACIPPLRKIRTGRFEVYLGDRLKKDGSEPRMGGAVIFAAIVLGLAVGTAAGAAVRAREVLCVVMYLFMLTGVGFLEDIQKDTGGGPGMKDGYRLFIKLGASAGFCAVMKAFGHSCGVLVLPFRMGTVGLGAAEIPINAVLMTVLITAVEVHDCQRGYHGTGVDGLCLTSVTVGMLGLGAASAVINSSDDSAQLLALSTAAACGAFLIWSMAPSKIYPGQSGSLLLGGALGAAMILSSMHLGTFFCAAAMLADGACAAAEKLVFIKTKKLLLKGASLHEHLRALEWSEYKIIALAALLQAAGAVGAAAMAVYESKLLINN